MSDWALPWAGGCRCGQTRIEVTEAPVMASACHCEGCQKMTSSAYALTLTLSQDDLRVTAGEPVIGGLHGETRHLFCPHCLTWMFTFPAGDEGFVNLRPSMLDEHGWFVPFIEVFTQARLPWAETGALYSYGAWPAPSEYGDLARQFARRGARPPAGSADKQPRP